MTIEITRGALRARVAAFLADDPGRLLVGGRWTPAADGATFATLDPATGETLASVARGSAVDADAAVAAASAALPSWARMRPADRGALLWRIAN